MSESFRILFVVVTGLWAGLLLYGLMAWRGGRGAWPTLRVLGPAIDLAGTWLGAAAVLFLFLGRIAYSTAWATAMGLIAMMLAVTFYQRAVLSPSLDSSFKRMQAGEEWERDWRFLWRMAGWARAITALAAVAALLCGLWA